MPQTLEMYSPLTPAECAARIAAEMDYEPFWLGPFAFWIYFGINPVIGRVTPSSLRLRARIQRSDDFFQIRRNPFQPILVGRMRSQGTGTAIRMRLTGSLITLLFFTVWFGGVITICVLSVIALLIASPTGPHHKLQTMWLAVLAGPGMLLLAGYAMVRYGRSLASHEGELLTDFIRYTLSVSKEPYLGPKPPKEHLRGNPP